MAAISNFVYVHDENGNLLRVKRSGEFLTKEILSQLIKDADSFHSLKSFMRSIISDLDNNSSIDYNAERAEIIRKSNNQSTPKFDAILNAIHSIKKNIILPSIALSGAVECPICDGKLEWEKEDAHPLKCRGECSSPGCVTWKD